MNLDALSELVQKCHSQREIAKELGVSKSLVSRYLKKYNLIEEFRKNQSQLGTRVIKEKECPTCLFIKPREEYHLRPDERLHSSCKECSRKSNYASQKVRRANEIKNPASKEETSRKISEARKKFLAENPDAHPWRKNNKFKSVPCENLKTILRENNVQFIEEYPPNLEGRFFSIDIALPDKRIALEINGNQHYEKDGKLKPYYQERQNVLERGGWTVYQIHYSICYNLEKWAEMLPSILSAEKKQEFDYLNYTPKITKKSKCKRCQTEIQSSRRLCDECKKLPIPFKQRKKKVSKEMIEEYYLTLSPHEISEKCGVKYDTIKNAMICYGLWDARVKGPKERTAKNNI